MPVEVHSGRRGPRPGGRNVLLLGLGTLVRLIKLLVAEEIIQKVKDTALLFVS